MYKARARKTGLIAVLVALVLGVAAVPAMAGYATTPRPTWMPANYAAYSVATTSDRVYVGGSFTKVKDPTTGTIVSRTSIFAIDRSTGALITTFNPVLDGSVRTIAVSADEQTIYIGGTFSTVNGAPRTRLAALTPDGQLVSGWTPSASSVVFKILPVGSYLYVAGKFSQIDGVNRGGLARLVASTGALDLPWRAGTAGGKPHTLAEYQGVLLVGGSFTSIKSQPRQFLAAVSLDTGDPTPWTPVPACDTCNVIDITTDGGYVFGGTAGPGGRAVKWDYSTGQIVWKVSADGDVQAVEVAGGVVYCGGHFGPNFGGQTRHELAVVDETTGSVLPWAPNMGDYDYPGVWDIEADSDYLRVAGGFRSFEGTTQGRYAELAYS